MSDIYRQVSVLCDCRSGIVVDFWGELKAVTKISDSTDHQTYSSVHQTWKP